MLEGTDEAIEKAPYLSRNFQVQVPVIDGTLESANLDTVEVKLSGKDTGDIGHTISMRLYLLFQFGNWKTLGT